MFINTKVAEVRSTLAAILCTILFSSVTLFAAVGPAQAVGADTQIATAHTQA